MKPRFRIVTDSTADLPPDLCKELDITVVPLMVNFNNQSFRDGIDISSEEFFRRLSQSAQLPSTSAPSVGSFEQTYRELAKSCEGIISIHISSKLSSTYQSAIMARDIVMPSVTQISVIDSLNVTLGLGLLVVQAAKAAKEASNLTDLTTRINKMVPQVHLVFFVDTLEYLQKGGRIGKARALLGSMLNIKPILHIEDGQVVPFERTRTRAKAIEGLYNFVEDFPHIEEMAILHTTTPDDVEALKNKVQPIFPKEKIITATYGPVVGTYAGPGALGVVVYEGEEK